MIAAMDVVAERGEGAQSGSPAAAFIGRGHAEAGGQITAQGRLLMGL
jgi:hypothetical protein